MRFGSGLARSADNEDLTSAAQEAALAARRELDGAAPDLACVFVCGMDPETIAAAGAAACEALGSAAVIGCSASGVIGPDAGCELQPSVAVWAAVLPGARVRTFHLEVLRTPDGLTVLGLPDPAIDDAVAVLLADPWSFPVDGFVELSNEVLPGLPLVGGLAGSALGTSGRSTWLCRDGATLDAGAVGVLIGGAVDVSTVVSQGCRPVGPTMVVTGVRRQRAALAGRHPGHRETPGGAGRARPGRSPARPDGASDRHRDGRVRRGARARRLPDPRASPACIPDRGSIVSATSSTSDHGALPGPRRRRRARRTGGGARPLPDRRRVRAAALCCSPATAGAPRCSAPPTTTRRWSGRAGGDRARRASSPAVRSGRSVAATTCTASPPRSSPSAGT